MSQSSDVLRETAEQVAALIPRYSWEIMDEDQRDALMVKVVLPRYGKTTKDGTKLGPTWWAEAIGAETPAVIRGRVGRLKSRSEGVSERPAPWIENRGLRAAKQALRDPQLAAEVLSDPTARAIASSAIDRHHREAPAPRPQRKEDPTLEMVSAMMDMDRSMSRLIENANGARRQGFLPPRDLREFAEKLRLYADAIDSIADSRGLTDDALAEWIGESA